MKKILLILLAGFLAGCQSSEDVVPEVTNPVRSQTQEVDVILTPLDNPLPGNVMPDFSYRKIADISNRASHSIRNISLQVKDVSVHDAYATLESQFLDAGLSASESEVDNRGIRTGFFSLGGAGGPATALVASGGTHIMVLAKPNKPEDEANSQGFTGIMMITVNAP